MTLETIIRYAIDGVLMDDSLENKGPYVQELVSALIDFGSITDRRFYTLLKKAAMEDK